MLFDGWVGGAIGRLGIWGFYVGGAWNWLIIVVCELFIDLFFGDVYDVLRTICVR